MAHNLGGHYYWEGVTTQIIVICSDEIIDFFSIPEYFLLGRGFVRSLCEMSPLNQGFFLPALYQSSSKLVTYATHDAGQSLHGK